jgi:predicted anti-sigma-YlaC factor YlaD
MSAREDVHLTDAQVSDYTDAVLDAAARADMERHLASCSQCRDAIEETRAVVTLAQRRRFSVAAPAELWPLVASTTIHLAAVRRQVLASMRGVLIVGAIALVAATAVVTWQVARWTSRPSVAAPKMGTPGVHAPSGGHPARIAPQAPNAPTPPRP